MIQAAPPRLLDARAGSIDRWQTRARVRAITLGSILAVLLLHLVDRAAFFHFYLPTFRQPGFFLPDWYQVLRQIGNMLTWVLVALMLWGVDAHADGRAFTRAATTRGARLVVAAAGAGLIAELLKLLVARERPMIAGGLEYQGHVYHWPLVEPLLGQGNLGFPSSHAAVAFGAAIALARLVPGTWPVMVFLALGCAWTRLLMGAHFLTDVVAGAAIAWAWVEWLRLPLGRSPR
ncbi:MAG: phosphatase PAP2 family protein [Phycisphaerales bacterium]